MLKHKRSLILNKPHTISITKSSTQELAIETCYGFAVGKSNFANISTTINKNQEPNTYIIQTNLLTNRVTPRTESCGMPTKNYQHISF